MHLETCMLRYALFDMSYKTCLPVFKDQILLFIVIIALKCPVKLVINNY